MLTEGGNVFRDAQGQPRTQRINLADIAPTVAWLERVTGLELQNNLLGSTGLKPSSGDLDIGINSTEINKEEFYQQLVDYVTQHGQSASDWVRKSGVSVHFLTPIRGRADTGFVQTDFMFMPNLDFSRFILRQDPNSSYKGATRNVLINSMAKALGYKLNQTAGISDRASNQLITDDPNEVARLLLNPKATAQDLASVEAILAALAKDPKREEKLADFRDHMQRAGTPLDENIDTEVSWLARLRDRIINQGMQVIVEGARIEHPEDLVFDQRPSQGLSRALDSIQALAKNPASATVKWDGRPAIIFGRKPTGEFVLTDKAGFQARGYDGLATSPDQLEQIMRQRGGERTELIKIYRTLFPLLRQATPADFRGYVQGDLLYSQRPPHRGDVYEFTPNTVTYRVPVDSSLGQQIADSQAAVVVHTAMAAPGAPAQPITAAALEPTPGLLILDASLREPGKIAIDAKDMQAARALLTRYGSAMDRVFDPAALRERKISDLPALMKQYINTRVRSGNYDNLVQGFGQFVLDRAPTKAPRIFQWATENKQAVAAVF